MNDNKNTNKDNSDNDILIFLGIIGLFIVMSGIFNPDGRSFRGNTNEGTMIAFLVVFGGLFILSLFNKKD